MTEHGQHDITSYDIEFRGYPVTLITSSALAILKDRDGILAALATARDTAEPGEPYGWQFETSTAGETIRIERFGGMLTTDRHEDGQWSVYLPDER